MRSAFPILGLLGTVLGWPPWAVAQDEAGPAAPAEVPVAAERAEDVRAIREVADAFQRAYDAGDAGAIAALFGEDAEIVDETGILVQGRDAVAELFAATFEDDPGATIELTTESIRFLGADAAREIGQARTTPKGGGPSELTRYIVLYARKDGRWLHDSIFEHNDKNPSARERLEELAWLVGEWVDESDAGIAQINCRWSEDGNFLVRDFNAKVDGIPFLGGHQRIGWDAQAEGFRSWIFDADGGHSHALWSRGEPGQWIIKAEGVLADGRAVTATQVLTFVNQDTMRWRSIDRTVGGRAVPDLPEIVLVRKPPEPKDTLPSPTTPRQP